MTPEELEQFYPFVYHMAEAESWPGIRAHGLRSTSALLDLYEIKGAERSLLEASRRPASVAINHAALPTAVIRDNRPLSDTKLERALVDGTPLADWYRLLNGKVFFWLTTRRLITFLSAGAYRARPHVVLKVRTADLLARYEKFVWLAPMNTGSTTPFGHPRSRATFQRILDFPFDARAKTRPVEDNVVELAVDGLVESIEAIADSVTLWQSDEQLEVIWTP